MNMGMPDVCLTPAAPSPIPVPYPNMAMHAMASPVCSTILLSMMPALNMGSSIPLTMGDEAGTAHPFFKQAGRFTSGNEKVFLAGMPAITLTSPTSGNNMNNPVGMVEAPGAINVLFSRAPHSPRAHAADVPPSPSAVGRLRIALVGADLPARVRAVTRAAPDGVVFDLRGCPGGELAAAVEVGRDLLPQGSVIVAVVDGDGDAVVHRARGDAYGGPVVVLVDRRTASAAEVLAGCLKAHGRALIVGERTYGKGVAGALVSGKMVDVARLRLADGTALDDGVRPHVELTSREMILP
jgi:carboxyl-terminal processing protease